MKLTSAVFLLLLLILAAPGSAQARVQEFGPDDARFTLDVPNDFNVRKKSDGVVLTSKNGKLMLTCTMEPASGSLNKMCKARAKKYGFTEIDTSDPDVCSATGTYHDKLGMLLVTEAAPGTTAYVLMSGTNMNRLLKILETMDDADDSDSGKDDHAGSGDRDTDTGSGKEPDSDSDAGNETRDTDTASGKEAASDDADSEKDDADSRSEKPAAAPAIRLTARQAHQAQQAAAGGKPAYSMHASAVNAISRLTGSQGQEAGSTQSSSQSAAPGLGGALDWISGSGR